MKVLMSAYACEPNKGSEPNVGWHWALQAARFHEVWVLTRTNNRAVIEAELLRVPRSNLHFVYHDLPRWASWWKRGRRGLHLYYLLWQMSAVHVVRRLQREIGFDVGHHITFVAFRFPSCLAWLNIPFVWGPVGGGERAPLRFCTVYGRAGVVEELVRVLSNRLALIDPLVRRTGRRANVILATTSETRAALSQKIQSKTRLVPAIGLDEWTVSEFQPAAAPTSLRLLYVGSLLHWKGVQLALRAIAKAASSGAQLQLTIIGDGPYRGTLAKLAADLDIVSRVNFRGKMPYSETVQAYASQDVFLFPSLHDSGGFVVLEAMAAGLPVICLDLGGPAVTVTDLAGIRVPAHDPDQVISGLAEAIMGLAGDPGTRRIMGEAGQARARDVYGWDRKGELLGDLYADILKDRL